MKKNRNSEKKEKTQKIIMKKNQIKKEEKNEKETKGLVWR
jgi:hypothetical protein